MAPPIPIWKITSILFYLSLIAAPSAVAVPCGGAGPIAERLAATIGRSVADNTRHSWHVHVTVPAAVSGLIADSRVSFDAPFILLGGESSVGTVPLTAVFHAGAGGEDNRMASYVAQTTTALGEVPGPENDWTVTAKLSSTGSMGHVFPVGKEVFFAYEFEASGGNTVALRLYPDLATLVAGGEWRREVRLNRKIALPAPPDTVTTDKRQVVNIGTPTIEKVVEEDWGTAVHFRFHYYPEGDNQRDLPGVGHIIFPPSGEGSTVVYDYDIWYGRFENKVNNALRVSQVMGKIGQRARLGRDDTKGRRPDKFLLLEGQMADAGEGSVGWLSWRPVLYELGCDNPVGAIAPPTLPGNLRTLANPHVTDVGSGYLLLSFFVPSEPFNLDHTSQYAGFDPQKCPTCAANPMEVAVLPARPGTLIIIVEADCVLGDDGTFKFKYKKQIRNCAWISKVKKKFQKKKVCALKKCKGAAVDNCCREACGLCGN